MKQRAAIKCLYNNRARGWGNTCEPLHFLWSFWGILQDLNFNIESCFEQIWVPCLLDTAVAALYECIKAVEKKEAFYKWKAGLLKSLSECVQVIFLSLCVGLFFFPWILKWSMHRSLCYVSLGYLLIWGIIVFGHLLQLIRIWFLRGGTQTRFN